MDDSAGPDSSGLADRWLVAGQAYLDGDLPTYAQLAHHGPDYVLTPPHGGDPRQGFDASDDAVASAARMFRGGHVDLEVFSTYASGDLAVLVAVERQHGILGDVPPQEWSLRITLVFRHDGDDWRLVHRHADPLTRPLDADLFAALARGDHASPSG